MCYLIAAISGLSATALLTTFLRIVSRLANLNFNVPRILGSLITMKTRLSGAPASRASSLAAGYVFHYIAGLLVALIYYGLWDSGIGAPDLGSASLLGIVTGILAVCFWYAVFKLHPLPPAVALLPYLVFIFIAHIIFAITVTFTFCVLTFFYPLINPDHQVKICFMERDSNTKSIWQTVARSRLTDDPAQMKDGIYDVIVVGAGITGISLALKLQDTGLKCMVAEANTIAFTTGGITAHLNQCLIRLIP